MKKVDYTLFANAKQTTNIESASAVICHSLCGLQRFIKDKGAKNKFLGFGLMPDVYNNTAKFPIALIRDAKTDEYEHWGQLFPSADDYIAQT